MITIENLNKYYGSFCALDHLNLSIEKGEFFGFVGANGAGKTTTLKILAGLIKPTSGTILYENHSIYDNLYGYMKNIGYMPDFFGVYDNLKVSEYMQFFASVHDISGSRLDAVTERLLQLVHLEDRKNQYVDSLSRGLKQKLCLARCLINDPQLLILDEPASGLDPHSRIEIKQILQDLNTQGKTIIISSHILSELSQMCTHLGIIKNGRMIIKDSVHRILDASCTSHTLIINVWNHPATAAELIKNMDTVENLSYIGHELRIRFNGTEQEASELLKILLANGIIVTGFRKENGSLESLFLELTGEEDCNEN